MRVLVKGWRYWRNLLLFAAGVFVLLFAAGAIHVTRRAAYDYVHPARWSPPAGNDPAAEGVAYQDVWLTTADGLELAAWYTSSENGAVILVAHGYGSGRSAQMHALFARHGYGVLSWDFRAHGESGGELSTLGYHEVLDVEAALDWALAQDGVRRVGAWGGSMGGATVILAAAARPEIEAVVADSAYAALEEELAIMVRLGVLRPLVRFFGEREAGLSLAAVRPADQIGRIAPRPLLIVQGLADSAIRPDSGERLCAAAGESCALWTEQGVGHLGMLNAFPAEYERRVIHFFSEALLDAE